MLKFLFLKLNLYVILVGEGWFFIIVILKKLKLLFIGKFLLVGFNFMVGIGCWVVMLNVWIIV